jgi:hypothetical protein
MATDKMNHSSDVMKGYSDEPVGNVDEDAIN